MQATLYRISGEEQTFKMLKDAKCHIWHSYTSNGYFGKEPYCIIGYHGDEIISYTEIKVSDTGKLSFGKPIRQ